MENIKEGKLLYHLTRLSNLDSIIEKGLKPRKQITEQDVSFIDVVDPDIISKRTLRGLQEYVPFHFHPYSAFDKVVKSRYIDEEFVYICISRDLARNNEFKILPEHPLTDERMEFYDYDEEFNLINWDIMHSIGNETKYKKLVKMAECLTYEVIPAKSFQCIYVKDKNTKHLVEGKLKKYNIVSRPPFVDVGRWFDT